MAIAFNEIPTNFRVPFTFIEFDSTQAVVGPAILEGHLLVFGQMASSGTATPGAVTSVTSVEQSSGLFGASSMLHRSLIKLFQNNNTTKVSVLPLADPSTGVRATATLTFSGTSTENGNIILYIAGRRVAVNVLSGQTATQVAAAVSTAIVADKLIPFVSIASGGAVTLTHQHRGVIGNEEDIRLGFYPNEKELPAGITLAIAKQGNGAGMPDIATAISSLPDEFYTEIVFPYTDNAAVTLIENEAARRWGPTIQKDVQVYSASNAAYSALQTFGNARNSKHSTFIGCVGSPNSAYEWAAALAAVASFNLQIDPARPLQTLELKGVLPPEEASRFSIQERNLLLYDGITTYNVDQANRVHLERVITTYQQDAFGEPDTAYLDVNTLATLRYLRYDFRTYFQSRYPRHKLADDNARVEAGQATITPSVAKAEAIARAYDWVSLGLIENLDAFKNALIVERDVANRNALNFQLAPDLGNQYRSGRVKVAFKV